MKKSASGSSGRATRMKPSAPTPRWRSQIAAMSSAVSGMALSRSSISTKSLPVPLYLPNRISVTAVELLQLVDQRGRSALVGVEPPDPGIAPEPRHLPAGQLARSLCGARDRVLQGTSAGHVLDHLSVPDGLARGEGRAGPPLHQRPDLLEPPGLELLLDAPLDPERQHLGLHPDPRGHHAVL